MDLGLKGRRALVLGASKGLGKAIAAALGAEGARVAIASRDEAKLREAQAQVGAELVLPRDLSQPGAGRAVVEDAVRALGGLDVLVTNTGGPPKSKFQDTTEQMWRDGFQSLWLSATDAITAALPVMQRHKFGRILLVTSVAAKEPMKELTVSNGLRAGLLGVVKSLAPEVAADGITVNALLPGYTKTERMDQLGVTDAQIAGAVPAGRMGKPEEFAALAAFLCGVQSGYLTGQAIAVDGGWMRGL